MDSEAKLKFILTADSKEVDEAFKKINNSLEKSKKKIQDMQPVFSGMQKWGTVAFGAITVASGLMIKAYQEQEKAEKRLEKIAKQVTGATDDQIKSYKKLASKMQKVGVMGDEVIMAGQSQLASFTKNTDVVTLLSKNMADLSVAQYGVNVTQEQAIQSANMIGKAMTGQLGAMTRAGILVSEEYEEAFKEANTEMERAEIISKIISDNYGGLNEAMRQTSAGGLQALKNSWGDMLEVIGKALIPALVELMETVTPIIDKFAQWAAENPELLSNIILIGGGIAGLLAVVGTLGTLLPGVISAVGLLGGAFKILAGNPVILIVAGLALIVTNLVKIINGYKEMQRLAGQAKESAVREEELQSKTKEAISRTSDPERKKALIKAAAASEEATRKNLEFQQSGIFTKIGMGLGLIPGYADGGIVSGPIGSPQLAVVHGGEKVLTAEEASGSGNVLNFIFNNVVAGDEGVKKIITQTIDTLNRQATLRGVAGQ